MISISQILYTALRAGGVAMIAERNDLCMRGFDRSIIEVHGFKWPHRPTAVALAYRLGADAFGQWLGIRRGSPWWAADKSRSGVFEYSFVKLIPPGTFWTACFHPRDPIVDVDIVLPVCWSGNKLEEVDLELDILRAANGAVSVRDQDEFDRLRTAWDMPGDIAAQAQATCEHVRTLVEQGAEPFSSAGQAWLARFIADIDAVRT
jgi:uncharacterized protein